jgi:hypothetical protein
MSYESSEGIPDIEARAYILLDGSSSMAEPELKTGERKHRRAAWMVQEVINATDDPQYEYVSVSVASFSANRDGVKVLSLLDAYRSYESKAYTGNTDLGMWDVFSPAHRAAGMGGMTPLGTAVAFGRRQAEQWVNASPGQVQRRAVIYVLTDGMNNVGPDGMEEKKAIAAFNASSEKGYVRLSSIGYFQSPPGDNPEEDAGRRLLRALVLNPDAYFESDNVTNIVRYILSTTTQVMGQPVS